MQHLLFQAVSGGPFLVDRKSNSSVAFVTSVTFHRYSKACHEFELGGTR